MRLLPTYQKLLENNQEWAAEKLAEDKDCFSRLANGQSPPFLFIGCSDSRNPIETITQSQPGDIFVHRNIGNQVLLTDVNVLSVLDYAVNVLQVRHIIVCGHYNCGAVGAAIMGSASGIVNNWIDGLRELYLSVKPELDLLPTTEDRIKRLAEINVLKQAKNVCKTSIIQNAFLTGRYPVIHAWIFDISKGLIKDQPLPIEEWRQLDLIPDHYVAHSRAIS